MPDFQVSPVFFCVQGISIFSIYSKKESGLIGMEEKITYKNAGVDTEKGREFIQKIKRNVESTHGPRVIGGLGGFAGAYDVSVLKKYKHPILLSGTDGVGTKIELARLLKIYNTIGIDLVAMCVNDILVCGGEPFFFLDYIACGKLDPEKMDQIVSGIVQGCKMSNASLLGGETAEHPGTMKEDEFDLAGFVVGAVEKDSMIDGSTIRSGDKILGLESSGPHSNGFSLIRKLLLKEGKYLPTDPQQVKFLKDYALKPTRIYVSSILKLLQQVSVKGMVHITGGGYQENVPRILPQGTQSKFFKEKIPSGYFFEKIKKDHKIEELELFATFNMGIGYMVIVSEENAELAKKIMESSGEVVHEIGEIVSGNKEEVQFV
ncbi:phosphoribosylformylglycinamidine cyclo-ligase [Leptospira interrogans]|uniref:phosphoribosylformylglycinamidine cyclo-ligase n=2 Tax=Leptospiraceae TaxID=170 RepID=UPI0002B9C999|nr:phosphoribosylformylglycinamidine cyclo-ligase [Leptospira interrogans]EMN73015.1 phosphoribosylformylglycinamidine cyclo-ligase [Leptospira interrogans serovar Bataviae str. UI 08561]MCL8309854.1 phosphoribosylformylglycinamidine cyclo-ligase [Leptospira interrogans]UID82453.1 phosphoribosylformylglycinamidine cyclo-ligase [Leptospira interrogans]UML85929.1 phosphoribosylformylglycinamidine cyclo-ligase [Leptospira interrogans]UMQ53262.1 phosphoribosylformylglycinamidine cyclo-ligase [Lept